MPRVPYVAITELGEALESADRHLATECSCAKPKPSCRICSMRHRIQRVQDTRREWQRQATALIRDLDDVGAEVSGLLATGCKSVADGLEAEAEVAQARSNLAREEDRF